MKKVTRNNLKKNQSSKLIEKLEDRRLMSASVQLVDGMLILQGNARGHNRLTVTPDANGTTLFARADKAKGHYLIKDVQSIRIVGGDRPDEISIDGTVKKRSFIVAGKGADTVIGGGGSDSIVGGSGNDSLTGGGGDDLILGQGGSNKIDAGKGDDPTKVNSTSNSANKASVKKFALIDATTNEVVATLGDGSVLNLAKLPKRLNVSAVLGSGQTDASVKFVYDGADTTVENHAPYAFAADSNGDFNSWTPRAGTHTIRAIPYADSDAKGAAGTDLNVTFTVINDEESPALSGGAVPGEILDADAPAAAITAIDTSVPAGNAIHVNGLTTSLKAGDNLNATYEWDFGDDGAKYNTLKGFNAAHAYNKPGTYEITLKVTNSAGKTDTATTLVTITPANRAFIYVSPDGNDNNSGQSENAAIKTFARASQLVGDNTEVLFERGATYTVKTGMDLGKNNVTVGAYGTGNKPVLKYTGGMDYGTVFYTMEGKNVVVKDLAFDSSSTSTGHSGYNDAVRVGGTNVTVRDCSFINVGSAINTNGFPEGVLVQDNKSPNLGSVRAFFAWVQGSDQVYLGNYTRDSLDAHNLRMGGADRVNIQYNNFTNLDETAGKRGTLTIHKGNYVYIAHNTLTDGALGIGPLDAGGGMDDIGARLKWVVIEENTINSLVTLSHGTEHLMVRNNVIRRDNDTAIDLHGYSDTYKRGISDVYIENNTVFNNGTLGKFLKVANAVDGVTVTNNLYLAPNFTTGSNKSAPLQINNSSLAGFRLIADNIWPEPTILDAQHAGVNYVGTDGSNEGYKTKAEWEAYGVVQHDQFADVKLTGSTYVYTLGGTTAGAEMKRAA